LTENRKVALRYFRNKRKKMHFLMLALSYAHTVDKLTTSGQQNSCEYVKLELHAGEKNAAIEKILI